MDEIVRVVKVLQMSDKEKVAVPANWPNNELIQDRVIIPPQLAFRKPGNIPSNMNAMIGGFATKNWKDKTSNLCAQIYLIT